MTKDKALKTGTSRQSVYCRVICGCYVFTRGGTSIVCQRCNGKRYVYEWI